MEIPDDALKEFKKMYGDDTIMSSSEVCDLEQDLYNEKYEKELLLDKIADYDILINEKTTEINKKSTEIKQKTAKIKELKKTIKLLEDNITKLKENDQIIIWKM